MDQKDHTISAADDLARLLSDQRGTETLRALRRLAEARTAGHPQAGPRGPERPRSVGLWEVTDSDAGPGLRVGRGIPPAEGSLWSSVTEVPGKGAARRVVLLGESAARGYLLDPVGNPAQALQQHLDAAAGPAAYQCVDLARTNMLLPGLRELIRRVPHLDPDVVVLFAGNNWTASVYASPQTEYTPSVVEALRHRGYRGMREALLEERILPAARALLTDLLRLRDTGVEPVIVVPEFNLTGWSPLDALGVPEVPSLPEKALAQWYALRDRAVSAVNERRWETVREGAEQMRELDEGLSPLPGHLLGRALEALGDDAGARAAYEQSRDSVCGLALNYAPRTPRVVQDLLRDFADANAIACVDLAEVLSRADAPELPDAAHFLDYCHLSDSGIELAMAEVARRICGPGGEYGAVHPPTDAWGRAVSLLLAAVFNALHGQCAEVIHGYLRRALDACPQVVELAKALNCLLNRPGGPLWTGTGFEEVIREPNAAKVFDRFADSRPDASRLWVLRECLSQVLGTSIGADAGGSRELLEFDSVLGAVANHTPSRCHLQANTPATGIPFVLAEPADGVLRMTYRQAGTRSDPIAVRLNGAHVGELVGADRWSAVEFPVPRAMVRTGLNLVEVIWPRAAVSHETRLVQDAEALARGEQPYVLPIFGELYSVTFDHSSRASG